MITIIATICYGLACQDVVVTNSALDPTVTMQWCGTAAQPQLAAWMTEHWTGYRLAGWKCQLGDRGRGA